MGSMLSKTRPFRSHPSNNASRIPALPQELLDEIMDHLAEDYISLRHCSMAARTFVPSCRRHLFRRVVFRPHTLPTWKITFPDPSTSPAAYTREMRIHLTSDAPTQLAEYMPYFTNVRNLTLNGGRCETGEWISSIGRLPTSIRSLTMQFVSITDVQVLKIMEQLPNLDDFSLWTSRGAGLSAEAGEILGGRYGGNLDLKVFHASLVRSLLKAPEGLGFKSIKASCNTEDDFPAYVDLVATCRDTLSELDISVPAEAIIKPAHTFDFSRHKSLEHLSFSLLSNFTSCRWLSTALSTINPTNSPRLNTITIYLYRHVAPARIISETTLGETLMKDLRDVGTEIKRIKAESGGSVKFNVVIPLPWVTKPLQSAWQGVLDSCSLRVEY